MPVADRLAAFGTTVFAEMSRLAAEHGAVNLSQGFPDFDGPAPVKEAARRAIAAGHGQYAPTNGVPVLAQAVGRRATEVIGRPVDPAGEVTVTAGCTEAIAASLLGLLNPGDEVVLFEPYYDSYRACVALAGGVPRFVTLRAPDFTFDPEELKQAFTGRTRAVLVNTPHNPTGRVFSRQELQAIADLCIVRNAVALSDEVYERLVFEPGRAPHVSIASLPGMAERTIVLSSLGKTFSLTGWKIGWAVAPPDLSRAVRAAHQFLTFAVNTPMQHAAAEALDSPASYYDGLVRDYRGKRDLLAGALREIGFELRDPEGSYFLFADHSAVSRRLGLEDDVSLCRVLIERYGVAAIPPTAFYENKAEGRKLIRFAFCKKDGTLREAIARLKRIGQ